MNVLSLSFFVLGFLHLVLSKLLEGLQLLNLLCLYVSSNSIDVTLSHSLFLLPGVPLEFVLDLDKLTLCHANLLFVRAFVMQVLIFFGLVLTLYCIGILHRKA